MYTNEELKELKKQQQYLENMLNKENNNKAKDYIRYQLRILKEQVSKYSNVSKKEYSYYHKTFLFGISCFISIGRHT